MFEWNWRLWYTFTGNPFSESVFPENQVNLGYLMVPSLLPNWEMQHQQRFSVLIHHYGIMPSILWVFILWTDARQNKKPHNFLAHWEEAILLSLSTKDKQRSQCKQGRTEPTGRLNWKFMLFLRCAQIKKNKIVIASTLEMQTVIYWKHWPIQERCFSHNSKMKNPTNSL